MPSHFKTVPPKADKLSATFRRWPMAAMSLVVGVVLPLSEWMPAASANEPALLSQSVAQCAMPAQSPSLSTERDPVGHCLLPRQRNRDSLNQIYEFDHARLGKRIPVILVPGRAEEFQHNSWWKGFHKATSKNPDFKRHFKVYVFLYNSTEELDVQAQALVRDLKKRFSTLPDTQPLMLVTYSLGGVIARNALQDNDILNRVDTMVAIAVPFHGSPMFDPYWFSEYLNPPNRSPLRRLWDRSIYRAYMFSKSNLTRGLRWDNFDSSKPQFHVDAPHPERSKIVGDQALSKIQPFQEYPNADEIRHKTVVYASYLVNGYTNTITPYRRQHLPQFVLDNSLAFPKEMVASILPFYGFTVHSVFTYMNHQMANIPTYTPENPEGQNTHLYRYNDGAIPMSSMLFLPPRSVPYDEDINTLVKFANVRKSRVFVNVDHLHVGQYSFLKKILSQPDVMHRGDGVRTPYKWLEKDLLDRQTDLGMEQRRQAKEAQTTTPTPEIQPAPIAPSILPATE
jgi:pimeloyl-ACP methyl ester carboxylesterase